jgi:hypothetical protein
VTDTLPTIDPRHTALLVMDFQVRALGAISEAGALLAPVADAIAIAVTAMDTSRMSEPGSKTPSTTRSPLTA